MHNYSHDTELSGASLSQEYDRYSLEHWQYCGDANRSNHVAKT